jgi:hypothetical protein
VPSGVSSATETVTGAANITGPGVGAVLLNAGKPSRPLPAPSNSARNRRTSSTPSSTATSSARMARAVPLGLVDGRVRGTRAIVAMMHRTSDPRRNLIRASAFTPIVARRIGVAAGKSCAQSRRGARVRPGTRTGIVPMSPVGISRCATHAVSRSAQSRGRHNRALFGGVGVSGQCGCARTSRLVVCGGYSTLGVR